MKKLLLTLLALSFALMAFAQVDITIGTGTSTGRYPLNDFYKYSRSQSLYMESEIGAPGTIHKLRWYRNDTGANTAAIATTQIWLKSVTNAVLTGTDWEDPGTLVAEISNIDLGAGGGWYEVDITDFAYSGGNLLVSVYTQNAPFTSPHAYWRYTSTTGINTIRSGNSDSSNPPSLYLGTSRPNIQINMTASSPTSAPNPAAILSPTDAALNVALDASLNWSSGGGFLDGYYLSFGTVDPYTTILDGEDMEGDTSYEPQNLAYGTEYWWQVVPYNTYGNATGCPTWSFTTRQDPTIYVSSESPWLVDFGTLAGDWPVVNWSQLSGAYPNPNGTSTLWIQDDWLNVATPANKTAKINIYGTARYGWLVTPPISIPATGYELKFDLGLTRFGATTAVDPTQQADDRFMVIMSDSPNMANPIILREYNNSGSDFVYNNIPNTGTTVTLPLDGVTGTKYFAFYGESTVTGGDNDLFVDNVTVRETPADPIFTYSPSEWAFGEILINSTANKSFTLGNNGGGFIDVNSVTVSGDFFALSEAFSPISLGAGETSAITVQYNPTAAGTHSGTITISTSSETIDIDLTGSCYDPTQPLPYTQDFNGGTSMLAINWTGTFSIMTNHGTSGSNGLSRNLYSSVSTAVATTPPIGPLAPDSEILFDYRYVLYSGYPGTAHTLGTGDQLQIQVSTDGVTFDTLHTIDMNNHVTSTSFAPVTVNVSAYSGNIFVRFNAARGTGDYYLDIDNVIVREVPLAPIISVTPDSWDFGTMLINTSASKEFTISNIGAGTLNVTTVNVTGTGFALAEAFTPVALLPLESASFTVNFNPLTETTYSGNIAINDNRAVTNIPLIGAAIDATIYSGDLPHIENFDSVTIPDLPVGWTSIDNNADNDYWKTATGYANSGDKSASIYTDYNTANDDYLVTPPIELTGSQRLSFWTRARSTSEPEELSVVLSTTTPTSGAFTNVLMTSTPINFTTYTQYNIDLDDYNGICYIAFKRAADPADGYYLYIDDVKIDVILPEPPEPATLVWPLNSITTLPNPLLEWAPSATGEPATGYKVYMNDSGTFTETDLIYEGTATQFQTADMGYERTYYWKVLPINAHGSDPTCPTWGFSTPGEYQLAEGFEPAWPPAGWSNIGSWSRGSTYKVEGTYSAYKAGSTTTQYVLSTPMVTIVNGSTLQFGAAGSTTSASLEVVYSEDRTTWTQIGNTITHTATYTFTPQVIDLSDLAGNNYYLGFRTGLTSGTNYIDHIIGPNITPLVPGAPTLTAPADAAVNQSRYPSLSWSAPSTGGVPTGYNVYLDTVDGSTLFASNVTSPYTLTTPLEWEQTYYWTVKAFNAAGTGDAPAARSFTVMADPTIYELPYSVDFGTVSGDWPVAGWSQLSGFYPTPDGTSAQWVQDDWLNVATPANKAARINIYGTARYGWLVTPPIAIPADGYELKFDVALLDWNGTVPPVAGEQADDKFIVVMSDTPTMSNPVILREWNNDDSPHVFDAISHTGTPVTIPLTGITGTKYFAFYGESSVSGGDNDLMVDNVLIRQTPTGPPHPVTLTSPADGAENLSINGFNLTWTPAITGGNPTEYQVLMGTTNDPDNMEYLWEPGDVTTFNPTLAEITFNYSETWYWTVIATNGDGFSEVPTPFSFTIMPDPRVLSLPYSQNFDGVPSSSMPEAWTGFVNSTSTSAYVRTTTSYPVSAPNSMYLTNSIDTSADLRLITPEILVPMNSIKLSFSARAGSVGPNLLVGTVDALDGTGTFNQIASIPLTAAHIVYTISFAEYLGTDQYICFKHGGGGTYRSIYIDNVYMEELVDTDMSVVSLTGMSYGFQNTPIAHTVTVKNNGTEPVSNYTVYLKSVTTRAILGQESFTDPLAADATNAVEFTWNPTSLGAMDIYGEVYVADDAEAGNNTTDPMAFNVYQEGILFEGFEGGVIPANWTVLNADGGTQVWQAQTINPYSGTYAARVRYETSSLDNDDWLITPPLQVTSGTTDNISFWMRTYSSTSADHWQVLISTTDTNPASFTMIDEGDGMLANYVQKSYNLDSYGDAIIYLAVRYMGAYDWYLYVDEFVGPPVYEPASLDTPEVTISTVGSNVVLNWDAIPYATSYEVMAADAPEGPYTLATTVTAPTYSSAAASKKFYKVIAKAGATRSIVSPVLSLEQQLLQDEMDRAARSRQ